MEHWYITRCKRPATYSSVLVYVLRNGVFLIFYVGGLTGNWRNSLNSHSELGIGLQDRLVCNIYLHYQIAVWLLAR